MTDKIRIAQIGTRHGHAKGKLLALLENSDVEFAGLWEPDADRQQMLQSDDKVYQDVTWVDSENDLLEDPTIAAIASEGSNAESLDQTEAIVRAGKHVWYDKPAGENWEQWQQIIGIAKEQQLQIQMGYMFRYHDGFCRIAEWVHDGLLGHVFAVRAHMSTNITVEQRRTISQHQGGILFDLGGHVLDQVVWLLGRPHKVTSFLRNDTGEVTEFSDNTLTVLEFESALATVDIAAMEPKPMARRFEVYGTEGSAILLEPFEPGSQIRLCLLGARDSFAAGDQLVPINAVSRQTLYERELEAFVVTIRGEQEPDRTYEHELLVQETLLRSVNILNE